METSTPAFGYAQLTDVINKQSYRGWEGSFEAIPFTRFPRLGLVGDASGFYRKGVTQYNFLAGPRFSVNYGKWRPFVHAMAGIRHVNSFSFVYNPIAIDVGGGADYKLPFKNFSWRVQGDYDAQQLWQCQPERLPRVHRNCLALLSRPTYFLINPLAEIRISSAYIQNFIAS